jgi:tryptophan 2,3-dioxygenase
MGAMPDAAPTTYGSYLCLPELLELQRHTDAHDELLFVVIHQSHELWFKLLLHELDAVLEHLEAGRVLATITGVRRMREIVSALVHQWSVLGTMTPRGYLEFRDDLQSGSGFQSAQFRELEASLGHDIGNYEQHEWLTAAERECLLARKQRPSLRQAFLGAVEASGRSVPSVVRSTDPDDLLATLAEALVDLDEEFGLWRNRHVLAVERQIGAKPGTGASMGVAYLRSSATIRFFPELWDERTVL